VPRRRLPLYGALAGVVVGLLAASALAASGSLDSRASAAPKPLATAPFLAAFGRSLTGTYVVNATYTRRLDSGGVMKSEALVVQSPPSRIEREFGGVTGTIDGRGITCSTDAKGTYTCGPGATSQDYTAQVKTDMASLRGYFVGPDPLYRVVRAGPGCFDLDQVRVYPNPPYGSQAHMCFDPTTGALAKVVTHLETAVDSFEAFRITPQVTPADLSLSEDKAYDSHFDPAG
jgi:hypothetical protein